MALFPITVPARIDGLGDASPDPGAMGGAKIDEAALAERGWRQAMRDDVHLKNGLNICRGQITHAAVAHDLSLPLTPPEQVLAD